MPCRNGPFPLRAAECPLAGVPGRVLYYRNKSQSMSGKPSAGHIEGILAKHIGKRGPSAWLFPSIRGDGPVSPNSLNQLLNRLSGIAYSGQAATGRENLLA